MCKKLVILILVGFNFSFSHAQDKLDEPRKSFSAVELENGNLVVFGGKNNPTHDFFPETYLRSMSAWNETELHWESMPPLVRPVYGAGAAALGNQVFIFGGRSYSGIDKIETYSDSSFELNDLSQLIGMSWKGTLKNDATFLAHTTNGVQWFDGTSWSLLDEKMPTPRSSYEAASVGGHTYLIGGWKSYGNSEETNPYEYIKAIDVFDLQNKTFLRNKNLVIPNPIRRAFCTATFNGKILLVGGLTDVSESGEAMGLRMLDVVQIFNPLAEEPHRMWIDLPKMPDPLFAPGCAVLSHYLVVFGGIPKTFEYSKMIRFLDLSDPASTWQTSNLTLIEPKAFPASAVVHHNSIVVMGGNAPTEEYRDVGGKKRRIHSATDTVDHIALKDLGLK